MTTKPRKSAGKGTRKLAGKGAGKGTPKGASGPGGRYPGLTLRILSRGGPAMGPGKAELLRHIEATGSISAAARAMDMSYRRAWQLVEAMNRDFTGALVTTETGGRRGGGACITELGRDVLDRFGRLEARASVAIAPGLRAVERLLRAPGPIDW
jgi:molybdate transport system regulatory protein